MLSQVSSVNAPSLIPGFFPTETLFFPTNYTTPSCSLPAARADHTHPGSFTFKLEAPELRRDSFLLPNRSIPLLCSGIIDPLRRNAAPCSGIIDPLRRNATPSDSTALWKGREHASAVEIKLWGGIR